MQMIVPVRSHTDTKVWTKIANTTDTRHSSVRDFPDTGVSSTTLECNGRGMTRKYEVYIDMNKLHTALFHVDMLTSYFSTTSTLVVAVLNNQLTTKFSARGENFVMCQVVSTLALALSVSQRCDTT